MNDENNLNQKEKKESKTKSNKTIIIIISIIMATTVLAGILYFVLKSKNEINNDNLNNALKNMTNLTSYKAVAKKIDKYDEESDKKECTFENGNEKITDTFGTYYYYNNKIVTSEEYEDNIIWYYDREWMLTSNIAFKQFYDEMFTLFQNYKFSQNKNVFSLVNEKYINEDGNEEETINNDFEKLKEIIENITNESLGKTTMTTGDKSYYTKIKFKSIDITIIDNKVSKIDFNIVEECYAEKDDKNVDCQEAWHGNFDDIITIYFSDYGTAKIDYPDNFESDLEKTTAGTWAGTYKGTITCPDGKEYDELLELTKDTKIDNNIFWDIDYKIFSCNEGYYTESSGYYTKENNKIVIYDFFRRDILTEFELNDNKLIEKDKSGNTISEFTKVTE